MKYRFILFVILIVAFSYTACKEKGSLTPIAKPANMGRADSVLPATVYPYTDTFVGPYNEYNSDYSPYNFSGTSTVSVRHVRADSIVIYATSIGIPISNGGIYFGTPVNDSNTYLYGVEYLKNTLVSYTIKITTDTVYCNIDQQPPAPENNDYIGTYTGYIQRHGR